MKQKKIKQINKKKQKKKKNKQTNKKTDTNTVLAFLEQQQA